MAVDFSNLLKKPVDSFKKPPTLPGGTYIGKLGKYRIDDNNKNKTPFVEFELQTLSVGEGIDASQLIDAEGQPIDVTQRKFRKSYYLTPEAQWRLTELLQSLMDTAGRGFDELLPSCPGQTVMFELIQKPSQDGQGFFNEVGKVYGKPAE